MADSWEVVPYRPIPTYRPIRYDDHQFAMRVQALLEREYGRAFAVRAVAASDPRPIVRHSAPADGIGA